MNKQLIIKTIYLSFLFVLIGCQTTAKQSVCSKYPQQLGSVNDFESVLTKDQKAKLESHIEKYESLREVEFAIVTTNTFIPDSTLFDYSLQLARCWGIGKSDHNKGILIAVSMKQRDVRIQTGTGLTDLFTDEEAQKVVDNYLIPNCKKGLVYDGLSLSLTQIFQQLKPVREH